MIEYITDILIYIIHIYCIMYIHVIDILLIYVCIMYSVFIFFSANLHCTVS